MRGAVRRDITGRLPAAGVALGIAAGALGAWDARGDAWPITTSETFVMAANGSRLYTRVVQPDPVATGARRLPAVVTVPGGTGAGAPLADRASWRELATRGFVVVAFNAEGRGAGLPGNMRSDGVEDCNGFVHQDDLKSIVEYTVSLPTVDAGNVGIVTMSLGLAMGAGALGRYPTLPVAYLIDEEGPHDSRVITFQEIGREIRACGHWSTVTDPSPENVAFWAEREAVRHIGGFGGRYLRLQAEIDHAQGAGIFRHAIEMIGAATDRPHGGDGLASWTRMNTSAYGNDVNAVYTFGDTLRYPRWVPGKLSDHATLEGDAVEEMARLVATSPGPRVRRHLTARPAPTPSASDSPFGFHPAEVTKPGYGANGYPDALTIGVKWTRPPVYAFWFLIQPDLGKQEYNFGFHDQLYGRIPAGIRILANIAPQGNVDEGRLVPRTYLPVDEAKYVAFVKATVARYDGDGIDDMPGLVNPITYWQVGNEPAVAQGAGFADLQRITYQAIKDVCSRCQVLIGGATGMPPVEGYIRQFDAQYKPILDALGGRYVDIMDFHWYGSAGGDYRGAGVVYDHIRAVLEADGFGSIPVWITEMGSYSGDPAAPRPGLTDFPPQSEAQQASDYLKRHVYPLAFGVRKIFPAFGLMEGFKYDGGYFDFTGLIYDGWGAGDLGLGVRKLAYYAYRKMTELLEGSRWDAIQTIRESSNVYAYGFIKNGAPLYVAWWDYFNDPTYAPGKTVALMLSDVPGATAVVTEAVPRLATGRDVTDYATAFRRNTLPVSAGTLTLDLGETPVFVELLP